MNIFSKILGHLISIPARLKGMKFGKNSFIGPGYVVAPRLAGVRLGKHCVVGAASVVTKSYPPYSVIVGSPARLIRTLEPKKFHEEQPDNFRDHTGAQRRIDTQKNA